MEMATAPFKPPQKKKHFGSSQYRPFPVPIASITKTAAAPSEWNYYDGHLLDDCVHVKKKGDARTLRCQGFFGRVIKTARQLKTDETQSGEENEQAFQNSTQTLHEDENDTSMEDLPESAHDHCDPCIELKSYERPKSEQEIEELHLSFEESFFLSYALGCLFVKSPDSDNITISEQWKIFCQRKSSFPVHYCVYHHFRSKGWVPADGLRYGCDLVLYRKGPPFFHSSYIVVVQMVDASTLKRKDFNGVKNRNFSWVTLSGMLRLATTVSKELMLCYVLIPDNLTESDLSTPDCIKKFSIQERIVSRWTSSKDRERELTDIDCDF